MPTATAFVDPTLAHAAGPYYTLFPLEPTPSDEQTNWVRVDAQVALKTQKINEWLDAIASKAKPGGNIVIVCHGNKEGLSIHIGEPKTLVYLQSEVLDAIRRNQNGTEGDDETAQTLKMDLRAFQDFKKRVAKVQALALDRVDARSCNVGQSEVTMSRLQVFFNCNTFCAPKLLDSFGAINYGGFQKDPAVWQKWLKDHSNVTITGLSPNRFALSRSLKGGVKPEALAESQEAVKTWAARHLPPSTSFTGSQLLFHGLTDLRNLMVFAGEPEFRAQLVEAYKGKEPSRLADPNAPIPRELP